MTNFYGVVTETQCPYCGYRLNAAREIEPQNNNPPSPGDVTLCFNCGGALEFDSTLTPQVLSDAVWSTLPPELQRRIKQVSEELSR